MDCPSLLRRGTGSEVKRDGGFPFGFPLKASTAVATNLKHDSPSPWLVGMKLKLVCHSESKNMELKNVIEWDL